MLPAEPVTLFFLSRCLFSMVLSVSNESLQIRNCHTKTCTFIKESELIAALCVDFVFLSQLHHLHCLAGEDFRCFLCFVEFTCRMLPA